jgi:16S rRNA (uracil1498-N3)-methyltransferase
LSAALFLVPTLPDGGVVILDGAEGHHAADVQRLRVGEALLLGDGQGATAEAEVTAVGRGRLQARILGRRYEERPDPRLVVVQAIAKGDRGELAVQAMTEVGVDEIVPWAAGRCVVQWRGERGERSHRRWVDTAVQAAKQARRAWVPPVAEPSPTPSLHPRLAAAGRAVVLHEEATVALTTVELPPTGEVVLVIGPEGGIAPDELAGFEAAGAVVARLGSAVLRTSTAGVAALAALSVRLGRW